MLQSVYYNVQEDENEDEKRFMSYIYGLIKAEDQNLLPEWGVLETLLIFEIL